MFIIYLSGFFAAQIITTWRNKVAKDFKNKVREAIANYISSEGCDCCQGDDHAKHEEDLAKLLNIPEYPDGYGYDFSQFTTKVIRTKTRKTK